VQHSLTLLATRSNSPGWAKKATGIDGLVRVISIAQSTEGKTGYNHHHNPHELITARWQGLRFQSCIQDYVGSIVFLARRDPEQARLMLTGVDSNSSGDESELSELVEVSS
jgi:hypothetical protein